MKTQESWFTPCRQALPSMQRDWLLSTGSLTQMYQKVCNQPFNIQLLEQGWGLPSLNEAKLFEQRPEKHVFHRHVFLRDGDTADIFARTIMPMTTYRTMRQRFDGLGNRSLGEMLFKDPSIKRGPIEVALCQPQHGLFQWATAHLSNKPKAMWGRRSCFFIEDKMILVNEIFLPSDKWSET
jgi:chorismate--pyruvate lyase